MPDDLAGVFYVAELDAGIAEDFDEFSDRAGIATAVATDGDDLAREATAPPLRGRFSPPTEGLRRHWLRRSTGVH